MTVTIGALCAGYGGIEAGIGSVQPTTLAWYAEYDAAPSAIMAHHHPDVTNLHDVTAIPWADLEPVDILTAGYPCQPFSAAGMRRGEDDPRHLWPHIAKGIAVLRPPLCVFENVRGHLSLGFDTVLHDLDRLGYDVRYYLLRAADVGAPHGRARLFIFATDRAVAPTRMPERYPVAVAGSDGWLDSEPGLFGADPFAGKLPPCGLMVRGHLFEEPRWLARADVGPLLGTPRASEWKGSGPVGSASHAHMIERDYLCAQVLSLLLTPAVNDMGEGKDVDAWDAWTERMRAAHGNGNGHGKSLAIEAQRMLLPTPVADNSRGLPSSGTDYASLANVAVSLLPTPSVADGMGGHLSRSGDRSHELLLPGVAKEMGQTNRWGDYAPAIARWEAALGRTAPSPTEPGAKGGHRLSPRFVEWMQGLPAGHVTDVPDLSRNNQLKALGNGVVPQQCAAAYRAFLADEMEAAA